MKSKLLLCIILSVNFLNISAQKVLQANYHFEHVRDTTQPHKRYTEEMLLFFNKNLSLYKSYAMHQFDSVLNADANAPIKIPKATKEQIFVNFNKQELLLIQPFLTDTFGILQPTPTISWHLIDSSKNIGSLTCKKAVGNYGGRTYLCWYTPDIAVRCGPWKLLGLPGLIVEAIDTKNEVSFTLKELKELNSNYIPLPQHITYTTQEKYKEIKEAFIANPGAAFGGDLDSGKLGIQKNGNNNKNIKLNNPLELL